LAIDGLLAKPAVLLFTLFALFLVWQPSGGFAHFANIKQEQMPLICPAQQFWGCMSKNCLGIPTNESSLK